ncbi:MAG: hypothetical protein LAO24_17995 [Acidobacteriia bacterium]|nr:hypothetical protein [Terriglobia bacterium]
MNRPAAYGIYPLNAALHEIVRSLNHAGFRNEDICIMLAPAHPLASVVREGSILSLERERGAVTTGLLGWLSEFGAVVIPSVAFFVHSRVFLHTLTDSKGAPSLYGNPKTLAALGFRKEEAERLDNQLRQVGAMVYVSCPGYAKTNLAIELLQRTGASESAALENEAPVGVPA